MERWGWFSLAEDLSLACSLWSRIITSGDEKILWDRDHLFPLFISTSDSNDCMSDLTLGVSVSYNGESCKSCVRIGRGEKEVMRWKRDRDRGGNWNRRQETADFESLSPFLVSCTFAVISFGVMSLILHSLVSSSSPDIRRMHQGRGHTGDDDCEPCATFYLKGKVWTEAGNDVLFLRRILCFGGTNREPRMSESSETK